MDKIHSLILAAQAPSGAESDVGSVLMPSVTAILIEYRGDQTLLGNYSTPTRTSSKGSIRLSFTNPIYGVLTLPDGSHVAISRYPRF